jgi:hypothetical protein
MSSFASSLNYHMNNRVQKSEERKAWTIHSEQKFSIKMKFWIPIAGDPCKNTRSEAIGLSSNQQGSHRRGDWHRAILGRGNNWGCHFSTWHTPSYFARSKCIKFYNKELRDLTILIVDYCTLQLSETGTSNVRGQQDDEPNQGERTRHAAACKIASSWN